MDCRVFQASSACILNCPKLFNANQRYTWKEYGKVVLDNGKAIKEIIVKTGGFDEFRQHFNVSLTKYREHYFNYKWLNLCRVEDLNNLGRNQIFIQTDYSAQPVLDSQDKLNCVGHGVCVLSCWVILHSPRQEFFMLNGTRVYYTFYECDHVRVVTPSTGKGKDQDWFLHCEIFDKLILEYKRSMPNLNKVLFDTN
jgi:hypothetical protein